MYKKTFDGFPQRKEASKVSEHYFLFYFKSMSFENTPYRGIKNTAYEIDF